MRVLGLSVRKILRRTRACARRVYSLRPCYHRSCSVSSPVRGPSMVPKGTGLHECAAAQPLSGRTCMRYCQGDDRWGRATGAEQQDPLESDALRGLHFRSQRGRSSPVGGTRVPQVILRQAASLVLLSILHLSCSTDRRPSLLLVTLDTVRADRLGCYGYTRAGTANIDSLAEQGVVFQEALSHIPLTLPSHATILTGLIPPSHGIRQNGAYILPDHAVTLAQILRQRGYSTAGFVGAFVLDSGFGLDKGFQLYDDDLPPRKQAVALQYNERKASEVASRAAAWLDETRDPFFAWVHFFDPHVPYDPPAPYDTLFPTDPYQGEIAFVDAQLGRLLRSLRKRGNPDRCLVVVVSDHGEALGEHGELTHGFFVYRETMRVPLIMSGLTLPPGKVVAGQVRLADVAPTVLELLGARLPQHVDGCSLVPLVYGGEQGMPSYGESFYPYLSLGWSPLRSVRAGGYTYIEAPRPELYSTAEDPQELENLASVLPTRVRELAAVLDSLAGPRILQEPGTVDREVARRLASLGYLSGAAPTHGAELRDPKDALELYRHLRTADVMITSGFPAQAESLLRLVLEADSTNLQAVLYLGVLLRNVGRIQEAAQVLERGCSLYGEYYELQLQAGICLRRLGRLPEARRRYERAIELFDRDGSLYTNLGILEEQSGRTEQAAAAYTRALELAPDDALAHFNLGMLQVRGGCAPGDALGHLERAVELDPELKRRPNVHTILTALRRVTR